MTTIEPGTGLELQSPVYLVDVTPIRGGRQDVHVHNRREGDAVARTDIVAQLRRFFAAIDVEAQSFKDDPVSNVQALAKVEAMLADLRFVRDTIHRLVAEACATQKIRRLTVDHSITVEATSDVKRTEWQNDKLLKLITEYALGYLGGVRLIDYHGQVIEPEALAAAFGVFFRPEWRLTALRDAGIEPDDYCTLPKDDETGKVIRTPTLKIVDNQERKITT